MIFSIFVALSLASCAQATSCGQKKFSLNDGFVVGGHNAAKGAWPWQASLQTLRGFHFCGGSLIHPQWILTASHCVDGQSASGIKVVLGEHNLGLNENTEQTIRPSKIIMHENYKQGGWMANDVALIKLQQPAQLNDRVGLACLPSKGQDDQGLNCFISGWGYTRKTSDSAGVSPKILQEISGPIWRYKKCKALWAKNNFDVHQNVYCFGNVDGENYGACNGDSGGPLSCPSSGGWQVVGVAHFAEGRCENLPGGYTKVEPYLDWIKARVPVGGQSPNPIPTSNPDHGKTDKPVVDGGDGFGCKGSNSLAAIKGDCESFLHCTGAGTGYKRSCAPGLHFNAEAHVCDWPNNAHRTDCM